jgi:flagellar hook-associated protein 3 FlgL
MRITESTLVDHIRNNISTSSDNFENNLSQLSSGKRITRPSDDPVGASKALALRSMITDMDQYQRNATSAKSFLEFSDSQLGSVTNLINDARRVAVAAANDGALDSESLDAYKFQINSIIEQLGMIADSDIDGKRVFAGTKTQNHPFVKDDEDHEYMGNDGAITSTLDSTSNIQLNYTGGKVFKPLFSAMISLKNDMETGDYTSISNNDLAAVDDSLKAVSVARADIGTKLNQVNDTINRVQISQGRLREQLASIEDTDIASSYTNMQLSQNVYAASLAATSRAMQYSLFNYLK